MESFTQLMEIANVLNSPQGCPWDATQTFSSLQAYILEEAHEVLEAVDLNEDEQIIEELGDLFYTVIFYAKVAEKEKRFTLDTILVTLKEKLIRRHPHVFGDKKSDSLDEIMQTWEEVKKEEKKERKSVLDGIPKTLPALQRALKMFKRMERKGYVIPQKEPQNREEELAFQIVDLVQQAISEEIDLESGFRRALQMHEKEFQEWELQSTQS